MSENFDITNIQASIQKLEDKLLQGISEDNTDGFEEIILQIGHLEAEIARQLDSRVLDKRQAKTLRKRIKRLLLPVRQYHYKDTEIPANKQELPKIEAFPPATEPIYEKDEKQTAKKTFPNPFTALNAASARQNVSDVNSGVLAKAPEIEEDKSFASAAELQILRSSDKPASVAENTIEDHDCRIADMPEWCRIYPFLSSRLSENIQKLFLNQSEFIDIFRGVVSDILWEILQFSYSEVVSQGVDLDEINNIIKIKVLLEKDFPIEAINSIRKKMSALSGFTSRTQSVKTGSKKRKEFNTRGFFFRHLVMQHIESEKIPEQIEKQFERAERNIDRFADDCKTIIQRSGSSDINKTYLDNDYFPVLLRSLRNAAEHRGSQWLNYKWFPKAAFKQACLPSLKEAILEWIHSEKWLMDLTVGTKIKEKNEGVYFATARPGKIPVMFPSDIEILQENDGNQFVIDMKNIQILFPYIEI